MKHQAIIHEMRYCKACSKTSNDPAVRSLVAIPDVFICNNCIELMVDILANQASADNVILFIRNIQQILKEPVKRVAGWNKIKNRGHV